LRGRNELEGVGTYVHIGDRLLDLGHVARNALAAGAVRAMMRVLTAEILIIFLEFI
jgi:hypothetical protein